MMSDLELVNMQTVLRVRAALHKADEILDWIFKNEVEQLVIILFSTDNDDKPIIVFEIPFTEHNDMVVFINRFLSS